MKLYWSGNCLRLLLQLSPPPIHSTGMGRAFSKGTDGLPSRNRYYGPHCNSRAIHSTSTRRKMSSQYNKSDSGPSGKHIMKIYRLDCK
jgi:hypothetical protein